MKPQRLEDVDVELEEFLNEIRRRCHRLDRGRVLMTIERDQGVTVRTECHTDALTEGDIDRLMRETPRRERTPGGTPCR